MLLAIHGLGSDSGAMRAYLEGAVPAGVGALVPDLRAHGLSGKPHDPKAYGRQQALDVPRLLDHLKLQRAHIVGFSLEAKTPDEAARVGKERLLAEIERRFKSLKSKGRSTGSSTRPALKLT